MKRFISFLKPYIKEIITAPLFKMTEALFELFVPLVIAKLIDLGAAEGNKSVINRQCLILCLLAFAGLCFSVTAQYFAARAAIGFAAGVRKDAYTKILSFSFAQYDKTGISTLITRMTSDIDTMQNGVNLTLRLLLRSPFVVFGAMIMAFTVDARAAVTFAVTVPLLAAVVFGIILSTMPLYKKVRERLDGVTLAARRALAGIRVIRAFGREDEFTSDFRNRNGKLYSLSVRAESISGMLAPVTYVIINIATAALIYSGAVRVNAGALSKGSVVALYNYMGQILVELIKLANLIITITKAAASGKRVAAVLDTQSVKSCPEPSASPDYDSDALIFDNVSFSYENAAAPALSGISFSIKKGESLGITGATGSGKSTLVSLINRSYEVTDGNIYLFGHPISEYSEQTLTTLTAVVPQKSYLFSGSIKDNLLLAFPDASDDEINRAVNISQSRDIIEKKGGINAVLEEGGSDLSGGQKQRLTIARALIKNSPVLILDDSSSALDAQTEKKLRDALLSLSPRPTVITVSQRISSVSGCDKTAVLDDGKLVGFGTHKELTENCALYREILESQKGGAENVG